MVAENQYPDSAHSPKDGAADQALGQSNTQRSFAQWAENIAPTVFIWPSVLLILFLSIFPLFVSLYLSFSRVQLVAGGYQVNFIGWANYERLFQGSQQRNFFGRWNDDAPYFGLIEGQPTFLGWLLIVGTIAFMAFMLVAHVRRMQYPVVQLLSKVIGLTLLGAFVWYLTGFLVVEGDETVTGGIFAGYYWLLTFLPMMAVIVGGAVTGMTQMLLRLVVAFSLVALAWLVAITFGVDGLPGSTVVTLIFVFGGVALQYLIGLGLALLVTQNLVGKRFFRVVFLLPMLITPVGVGFLFRMMSDTVQGPFSPIWQAVGLGDFSWAESATGARMAIIITDTWQWVPFMFIILLAALEGISNEPIEAALVDGANRWQMFRFIVLPEIVPVSITLILIRMIEAFKVIDLPRIMTRGGPGTATESITLYAFNQWKASATSIGFSSAVAYLLLILVTFFSLVLVNIVRRRILEAFA